MDPLRLWETYHFKEVNFTPLWTLNKVEKNHWPMHRLYKTFWWKSAKVEKLTISSPNTGKNYKKKTPPDPWVESWSNPNPNQGQVILVKFLRFKFQGPDSWCSNGWINLPKQGSQILFTSASESNKNESPQNKMFWFFNFAGNPKHVNETFLLQPKTKICKWKKLFCRLCADSTTDSRCFFVSTKKGQVKI